MTSPEDEQVAFSRSVYAEGNVEHWMTNIETMMVKSLYDITFKCLNEYPETGLNRKVWFFNYPAQPVLTVDLVKWTYKCEDAIREIEQGKNKKALEEFLDFSVK